ncbi:hypothetical protein BGX28_000464 [Mortierella sp. GBA30]|nr:hypothetical protein BGX28_000464 [Mortierella sp. GBA30]
MSTHASHTQKERNGKRNPLSTLSAPLSPASAAIDALPRTAKEAESRPEESFDCSLESDPSSPGSSSDHERYEVSTTPQGSPPPYAPGVQLSPTTTYSSEAANTTPLRPKHRPSPSLRPRPPKRLHFRKSADPYARLSRDKGPEEIDPSWRPRVLGPDPSTATGSTTAPTGRTRELHASSVFVDNNPFLNVAHVKDGMLPPGQTSTQPHNTLKVPSLSIAHDVSDPQPVTSQSIAALLQQHLQVVLQQIQVAYAQWMDPRLDEITQDRWYTRHIHLHDVYLRIYTDLVQHVPGSTDPYLEAFAELIRQRGQHHHVS